MYLRQEVVSNVLDVVVMALDETPEFVHIPMGNIKECKNNSLKMNMKSRCLADA